VFLCTQYKEPAANDDSWAAVWTEWVSGPGCPAFARLYADILDPFPSPSPKVACIAFAIARTYASAARAAEPYLDDSLPIAVAFHDQAPLMRLGRAER